MTKAEMKKEAIRRMRQLKLMPSIIKEFEKENTIYYSERQNAIFPATLYWLTNKPEWVEMVKEFEKDTGSLVYHAQLTYTQMGDLLTIMFVGNDENEWPIEFRNDGTMFTKVINLSEPLFSDYGSVQMKPAMGGVVRVA